MPGTPSSRTAAGAPPDIGGRPAPPAPAPEGAADGWVGLSAPAPEAPSTRAAGPAALSGIGGPLILATEVTLIASVARPVPETDVGAGGIRGPEMG